MKFIFGLLGCFFASLALALTDVHEYRLKNGLELLVKEDHRAPVVLSSVWYKVGGSYEPNGITGISHVLEHMMFRGTKQYKPGVFDKRISDAGGQQNAMTADDFTMYFQQLPASQLALSFKLEADRMNNLVLSDKIFAKEIQVVMEERRMRVENNPQAMTWERFRAAAFVNNPYHNPTVGWMTDLKSMTVKEVAAWYHAWYYPNNAIVVVVGDVEPAQVVALAKRYFGTNPKHVIVKPKRRREIAALGTKRVEVNLPAKLPTLIIGFAVPSLTTAEQAWQPYALDVLATVLGGNRSARLQEKLLREREMVTAISASYSPFSLYGNLLVISATPAKGVTLNEVEQAIDAVVEQLKVKPIDAEELKRVKTQIIASKIYSRDSLQSQAMMLGLPRVLNLSWQVGENYHKAIDKVTLQQVQEVARLYLQTDKATVATLHPES